jgi:hypothetical protein
VTLHVHKSYELKCDICGKPNQDGETDIVNLVADPNLEEPTLKSVDVCRDCRDRRSLTFWPGSPSWATCSARV